MSTWSRFTGFVKRATRQRIAVHERYITRYARPAVSAALGVFFGPVASTAFTGLTHYPHQYAATVGQRYEGEHGREARRKARSQAKRTSIYSLIGGGIGALGSGAYTLAAGGTLAQAGAAAGAGQAGAHLLGSGGTLFTAAEETARYFGPSTFITEGNLGLQLGESVPGLSTSLATAPSSGGVSGLVTQESLAASLGAAEKAGAASAGGSIWTELGKSVLVSATGQAAKSALGPDASAQLGGILGGLLGAGAGGGGDVPSGAAGGGMTGLFDVPQQDRMGQGGGNGGLIALGLLALVVMSG